MPEPGLDWSRSTEGPVLQVLLQHLAACPSAFLGTPMTALGGGEVCVPAVVSDLLTELGGSPLGVDESHRLYEPTDSNNRQQQQRARAALIAAWLLHHAWFRSGTAGRGNAEQAELAKGARRLLCEGLDETSLLVDHEKWVTDPDRREELVRHALLGLHLRPAGESAEVAEDRYTTLSSAERARVVAQARASEERARLIREEMARKAAAEAASSYSYE